MSSSSSISALLRAAALAGLAFAGLTLAGCAHSDNDLAKSARTPTELYNLKAEDQSDLILLAVHAEGLSSAQEDALTALAGRWREGGARAIQISAPHGLVDSVSAYKAAQAARARLIALGVPPEAINQRSYDAPDDANAPLKIEFMRYEAVVPACGRSWENLTETDANVVQSNFGCAVTANMAAQIADPADINAPRAVESADAGRRVKVIQTYRKGDITAGAADSKASGAVSNAIGSTQ
jgi:pilus assembly protein CpaD